MPEVETIGARKDAGNGNFRWGVGEPIGGADEGVATKNAAPFGAALSVEPGGFECGRFMHDSAC